MANSDSFENTVKTVSCFGHRDVNITDELRGSVREAISAALDDGVKIFLFGGMSDFDDLVYDIVSEFKKERGDEAIKRIFCFPLDKHLHRAPNWFVKKDYEELTCPAKTFDGWYKSIYFRNCAMIDMSDLVLFFTDDSGRSGSYKAYEYALKKHKKCMNFLPSTI